MQVAKAKSLVYVSLTELFLIGWNPMVTTRVMKSFPHREWVNIQIWIERKCIIPYRKEIRC